MKINNRLVKLSTFYDKTLLPKIDQIRGTTFFSRKLRNLALSSITEKSENFVYITLRGEKIRFSELSDLKYIIRENRLTKLFLEELQEDSVFYDIGSFHGYYSMLAGVGETSYAFEMDPENYKKLQANIDLNKHLDINAYNQAIWNENTKIKADVGKGGKSSVNSGEEEVEAIKLDSFAQDHKIPDIIKVDVEGAGYQVLKGAEETLKRHSPTIFIELHYGGRLESFGSSAEEIHDFLTQLGYEEEYRHRRGTEAQVKYSKV